MIPVEVLNGGVSVCNALECAIVDRSQSTEAVLITSAFIVLLVFILIYILGRLKNNEKSSYNFAN